MTVTVALSHNSFPSTKLAGRDSTTRILSLYARGMTVREIQGHLVEMYGTEVSPSLISSITDAVLDDVKVRDNGAVGIKAVYLALGIKLDGEKELLGIWIAQTEGARFWLQVMTELKNRGVSDTLSPAWMGSRAFLKQLRRCSLRLPCSYVSYIWCVIA